ncbi:efflux RND transporter periplasmic adaptor subunit [Ferrimonas balearica]|uniref:efflux RND transporter periplasmic adaptor subunit n=1 Tax=Ferrimonas balearica TaxID=44012 RepID=UPI001C97552A|nr:efflux RND transporter periplasmic adaptor subunit [Ferrimonas balearica]MBY5980088.1 efflux RND transporter periplasmic adaptor subunit [Ferrimonas balearica]MBY6224573.1 efflux RND transporter periplasmic adaptor subunit [Ferrimonas balearica]
MKFVSKRCLALLLPFGLLGCEQASTPTALPPPSVQVTAATMQDYQPVRLFSGRIEAIEDIRISAQVSGYLTQRLVSDGQRVTAGTPLFEIDPRPYRAALSAAKATLAEALASRDIAQVNLTRNKELLGRGSVSESDIDNLSASLAMAEARVLQAQAALEKAELDLSHTTIVAPIDGQVGAAMAAVGDLVGPQSGPLMTLVQQDPIRTSFRISERERLAMVVNGLMDDDTVEVSLNLGQGKNYQQPGTISFFDNRIDLATGTLALHADFANPEGVLLPGQFVQVQVRPQQALNGVVIPNRAVQNDQQGSFVMVVAADNTVERRAIEPGSRLGQEIVVLEGLESGERVVTSGLHRVRSGGQVSIVGDDV